MGCRESISGNFEIFEWYPKFAIMVPKKTSRPIRMLCRPFPHRKLPFSSILGGVLNSHGGVLNPNANRPTLDLPPIYQKKRLDPFYSAHCELETYDKYRRIYSQKKLPLSKTAVLGGVRLPWEMWRRHVKWICSNTRVSLVVRS